MKETHETTTNRREGRYVCRSTGVRRLIRLIWNYTVSDIDIQLNLVEKKESKFSWQNYLLIFTWEYISSKCPTKPRLWWGWALYTSFLTNKTKLIKNKNHTIYTRVGKTGYLGPWSRVMVCCSKLFSALLLWYLRSTCFHSFFGRNWRHQKYISKSTGL